MSNTSTTIILFFSFIQLFGQNYVSYFTGSNDAVTSPTGGVCLMGGATEDDEAMKWFLQRANGGDVLVLRTSGSDGYNNYFYSTLGVSINSVETIVCNNANASNENYIHQKIANAEAIWFAGGDQWDYISFWRNTAIDSLINEGIKNRNIVIGGTSAGMAIQGKYYFSAQNGTITSADALSNPYDVNATVDSASFIKNQYLTDVITDTHYDSPDRKGRHVSFLAKIMTDYNTVGKGIACDEYTAVCIDENGIASVYGDANFDDFAYFIQPNCELADFSPENCSTNNSLNWNRNTEALKVYKIGGNSLGNKTFNLNNWKTGVGGTWENWHVNNGVFSETVGQEISCSLNNNEYNSKLETTVFPNPTSGFIYLNNTKGNSVYSITNLEGEVLIQNQTSNNHRIDLSFLAKGVYILSIDNSSFNLERIKIILD